MPPTTAPPVAPTPAAAPAVAAAKAPETSSPSAPAGESSSPVAGYLADPQAMTRATGLFRAVCTGYCHSTQQGANREAPNLFDCDWKHGSSDGEIFVAIRDGLKVDGKTAMPSFASRMTAQEIWTTVNYIRTLGSK